MKNDNFQLQAKHQALSQLACEQVYLHSIKSSLPFTISVGGQSGSGKTTFAFALYEFLKSKNHAPFLLQQDDYFHLPPKFNHLTRIADINWVGVKEVNTDLLNKNIADFRQQKKIYPPEIDYKNNVKSYQEIESQHYDFLIVEGTYVSLLENIDLKLFCNPSYSETLERRIARSRDPIDDFTNQILKIEENIIRPHEKLAQLVLGSSFEILKWKV